MSKKHSGLVVLNHLIVLTTVICAIEVSHANAEDAISETQIASTLNALTSNGEIVANSEQLTISMTAHADEELSRVGLVVPGTNVETGDRHTMTSGETDQFLERLRLKLNPENFSNFTLNIPGLDAMRFSGGGGGG